MKIFSFKTNAHITNVCVLLLNQLFCCCLQGTDGCLFVPSKKCYLSCDGNEWE